MKRILAFALAAAIILPLVGCGNQASTPTASSETMHSSPSGSNATILPDLSAHHGILAVFHGDYNRESYRYGRIVLAWVDPETGKTNNYRDFSAKDADVIIDPESILAHGDRINQKKYMLQCFDSTYSKIIAKDANTESWGWVDTDGNYTNVTGALFSEDGLHRDIGGIGFYEDYYYFYCVTTPLDLYSRFVEAYIPLKQIRETGGDFDKVVAVEQRFMPLRDEVIENSENNVYRIPINNITPSQIESVPIYSSGYGSDTFLEEIIESYFLSQSVQSMVELTLPFSSRGNAQNYLIQSDNYETYAFFYSSGPTYLTDYTPVFYNKIEGDYVSPNCYNDWISSEKSIYGDGRIWTASTLEPDDSGRWEKSKDSSVIQLLVDVRGEELRNIVFEYTYRNPIVSTDGTRFACREEHNREIENGISTRGYISIFSISGEKLVTLNNTLDDDTSNFYVDLGNDNKAYFVKILTWE